MRQHKRRDGKATTMPIKHNRPTNQPTNQPSSQLQKEAHTKERKREAWWSTTNRHVLSEAYQPLMPQQHRNYALYSLLTNTKWRQAIATALKRNVQRITSMQPVCRYGYKYVPYISWNIHTTARTMESSIQNSIKLNCKLSARSSAFGVHSTRSAHLLFSDVSTYAYIHARTAIYLHIYNCWSWHILQLETILFRSE